MSEMTCILLFVKAPVPGRVKSRLAAVLGNDAALTLYRSFVLDMLGMLDSTAIPVRICVHPPEAVPGVSSWLGEQREYLPQQGNDLGERMENAFRAIFSQGASRALLIGSDIPDLPASALNDAFDELDRNDAVIGPALDGGYYLIGFRRDTFRPEAFHGMTWSGPDVFARTIQTFKCIGAAVRVLPVRRDVDTVDDLKDLIERSRGSDFAASRTMHCLKEVPHAEV